MNSNLSLLPLCFARLTRALDTRASIILREEHAVGVEIDALVGNLVDVGGGAVVVTGHVDPDAILSSVEGEGKREEEASRPMSSGLGEDAESGSMRVAETTKMKII